MLKNICNQGLLLISLIIVSCNYDKENQPSQLSSNKKIHIGIYSPYSCFNEIWLDNDGYGTCVFAINKDIVHRKNSIHIESFSDKERLFRLLDSIKLRPSFDSTTANDAYHFTINIDGRKVLDRYSQDTLLDQVLIVLLPYVASSENNQCDFFNQFKKMAQ